MKSKYFKITTSIFTALIHNVLVANCNLIVQNLLTENRTNPIGIDTQIPRFSWQLKSDNKGVMQTAYEIRISKSISGLKKRNSKIWESGKVESDQSIHVDYKGEDLQSNERYYWQVKVWDNKNKVSAWSEPAWFQTGYFQHSEWEAKWIEADKLLHTQISPLFRKEFKLQGKVKSANLYVTSQGGYEAFVNNKRVGDAYFTPGYTSYNKRLQYQVFDITDMLQNGSNALGIVLGKGWYKFMGMRWNVYKNNLSLLLQLDITYEDGRRQKIISDSSWKTHKSPILFSDIFDGEIYDARLEIPAWSAPGFDDSDWDTATEKEYKTSHLVATYNEPVRKKEVIPAQKLIITPEGDRVIDFGQNLAGWVQMSVEGKTGDTIKIYHAEVLDKNGNFYTENLRTAKQRNTYILKGGQKEIFEPHFTWQGFRYIKIEGFPGEVNINNFHAVAIYSDMVQTGNFKCSNELINQLQSNIQWGQRSNFLDIPTDCPQRNERVGWTGDAQVFARTAAFNFRVNNFFAKWLEDLSVDQKEGDVPSVVPYAGPPRWSGSPGWGDAATIVPWSMYLAYGDKRILENQFESMRGWVDHISSISKDNLWVPKHSFGDWLFYSVNNDRDGISAVTDKNLIAQCFYGYSTELVVRAAEVLGKTEEQEKYTILLNRIKDAFLKEYVTHSGRLVSGTQTAYVLALQFDMLPEDLRQQAAKRLVDNIRNYQTHITTGFLGTPYICHVLTRFGYTDVAYELLMQKTYPSWLYPVTMGATTIWERWDGIKPDSTFQTPTMNSFNHYAYGAIGDWMYKTITGLDVIEDSPGYKKIIIKPQMGGDLSYANATLHTYYGTIKSSWKLDNGIIKLDVEIPCNTTAEIYIPAKNVKENNILLKDSKQVIIKEKNSSFIKVAVGSGEYQFSGDYQLN